MGNTSCRTRFSSVNAYHAHIHLEPIRVLASTAIKALRQPAAFRYAAARLALCKHLPRFDSQISFYDGVFSSAGACMCNVLGHPACGHVHVCQLKIRRSRHSMSGSRLFLTEFRAMSLFGPCTRLT